ncbi:MAG: 2-C-methyl-D-erythritol 4-phosphate cytidylyltransferase [Candidatus Cloacimonetes bacterium HGW-Cloacimonetes-3]|jgi:2-C-methyl-D-erythritol 4-phosphate cytidylyltransferase|nr:MAG: 2-C-methyl-D-erythritol 4-phosphate cytidylyltransferase [Candidatus Cloacimonetes bacterium HGW-Cloacimonetes-3]
MERVISTTAIITAAGSGLRLPGTAKKQFRELGGIPILIRSLAPFVTSPIINNIIITVPEEDIAYCEALIEQYYEDCEKPYLVIAGGGERQDSVFGALQSCPDMTDFVFIHDGVRPFVSMDLLEELMLVAQQEGAAIPASPMKHTVKQIEGAYAIETIPRKQLIQVFTPQVFAYALIMEAYLHAYSESFMGTDDASLLEQMGEKIRYVLCSDFNLKITDETDLFFATQLIEKNMI